MSGAGYKSVAHALGINVHTARDWGRLYRKGCFRAVATSVNLMYDESAKAAVREFKKQGLSLREISRRTGVSPSTCSHWMKPAESTEKATQIPKTGTGGN